MSTAIQVQETALAAQERQLAAITQIISQQTPSKEIRTRKGRGGMVFKYTDGAYVIRTLNEALGHNWDFEADNEEIINWNGAPFEVRCRGRLTVRLNGQAVTKVQYGSQLIEFVKDRSGQIIAPVSIGDCFKGAATDAMKKCASLLGVALDLYDSDYKVENYADEDPALESTATGDPRPKTLGEIATPKQLWMIRNLCREQGLDVDKLCFEKFHCPIEEVNKRVASILIEELKANPNVEPDRIITETEQATMNRIKDARGRFHPVVAATGPDKHLPENRRHSAEMAKRFDAVITKLVAHGICGDELLRETNSALHDSGLKQVRSRYEVDDEGVTVVCEMFEKWADILDRNAAESKAS